MCSTVHFLCTMRIGFGWVRCWGVGGVKIQCCVCSCRKFEKDRFCFFFKCFRVDSLWYLSKILQAHKCTLILPREIRKSYLEKYEVFDRKFKTETQSYLGFEHWPKVWSVVNYHHTHNNNNNNKNVLDQNGHPWMVFNYASRSDWHTFYEDE